MKTSSICLLSFLLAGFAAGMPVPDPGQPDTVKISGGPLVVGRSVPLVFTIVNDEIIGGCQLGLLSLSIDGGFAKFDSATFINRLADPSVADFRDIVLWDDDGIPPDSTLLSVHTWFGNPIPVGADPIMMLYFTGVAAGQMTIDSAFFPPGSWFGLFLPSGVGSFTPQFISPPVEIVEGNLPPEIAIPGQSPQVTAGTTVTFDVTGASPEGFPVVLEFSGIDGYDSPDVPANAPTLTAGNPATFEWVTTAADVGIWAAAFTACDSSGSCTSDSIVIQIVSSDEFLVSFSVTEIEGACNANGMNHGNFDDDPGLELFVSGTGAALTPTIEVYDLAGAGQWQRVFSIDDLDPKFGSEIGYFNGDQYLDVAVMGFDNGPYKVLTALGDGANSFTLSGFSNDGYVTRHIDMGEFTGDNHLDVASAWYDGIRIFAGNSQGGFIYADFVPVGDSAVTVNSADFNRDGIDDLAVGTKHGVRIFLGDGSGGFEQIASYPQAYATVSVDITNRGSDFNDDNIFDLCITTPSVAQEYSEMVVYLGVGDGTFSQQVVRTVRGQIFGNCVGDFNMDGHLDIAVVNGAKKYAAILFGDGTGSFVNELRWDISRYSPQYIDCFDADLDGDLDVMVASLTVSNGNSLYFLSNQKNPTGYCAQSFTATAYDNAEMELTSSDGAAFSRIKNLMPTGDYYRQNRDEDNRIDDIAAMSVVDEDAYTLRVDPKPNLPIGEPFTLEFVLDDQLYRLAKDLPMSQSGYEFTVYIGQSAAVLPRPGKITSANPPMFVWQGEGEFDFQLASDVEFGDVLVSTVVDGNSYELASALDVTDTATYYWRLKPHGAPAYDCLYAVNVLAVQPTGCGDANGDLQINIADAIFLLNYVFKGGAAPDPLCIGDADLNGIINIADVVRVINYVFKGGPPPTEDCCL